MEKIKTIRPYDNFKWTTDHVKTFAHIYTGNFFKLPTFFHWENYQGKNIDGKINQYISCLLYTSDAADE